MASIYDNFDSAYQKYRNRQRLTGGTVDPSVVGALAEADLTLDITISTRKGRRKYNRIP
jgi:hypothetical protein